MLTDRNDGQNYENETQELSLKNPAQEISTRWCLAFE